MSRRWDSGLWEWYLNNIISWNMVNLLWSFCTCVSISIALRVLRIYLCFSKVFHNARFFVSLYQQFFCIVYSNIGWICHFHINVSYLLKQKNVRVSMSVCHRPSHFGLWYAKQNCYQRQQNDIAVFQIFLFVKTTRKHPLVLQCCFYLDSVQGDLLANLEWQSPLESFKRI